MSLRDRLLAFDVETWGSGDLYALQPFRARTGEAWMNCCAWSQYKPTSTANHKLTAYVVKPTVEQLRDRLVKAAEAKQIIVAWNAPFDVSWLIALGLRKEVFACQWLDGMLIARHATNEPRYRPNGQLSYGLKAVVERVWPEKAGYDEGITFNPQTKEDWRKLIFYNGLDAEHTLDLVVMYWDQLTQGQRKAAMIEAASIPMVAESIVEGVAVDRAAAEALQETLTQTVRRSFVTLKVTNPEVSEPALASPKQLAELLYTTWRLPVVKVTDKGAPSTDREALLQLAVSDERASLINDYREAKNNLTKFVVGSLNSADYNGDGRTRPQARIFGTYSGRMTYSSKVGRGVAERPSGVALHQWKRDAAFRRVLAADPDCEILEFDFAGQEFRWMAVESGDPVMLELCSPGEDAHAYMGAQCTAVDYRWLQHAVEAGDPTAKPKRQLGKVGNLSLQYRTSAATLMRVAAVQHKVKLTYEEALNIHQTYRRTYRQVPRYWRRQIEQARRHGYVATQAGRRVYLGHTTTWVYRDPENEEGYRNADWSHESTAINFPIQGVGADQKYLAMLALKDYLPKVNGRFAWELHDGLFVMVRREHADRAVHEIKHMLSNLPYEKAWGVKLPIAFPVDAKRSHLSWGDLVEVKE